MFIHILKVFKKSKEAMLKFPKKPVIQQENAKIIAISALSLLMNDEEQLMIFLNATGLNPADLRISLQEDSFQAGVLDYFIADEKLLLAFCAQEKLKPESVIKAAHDLGGGIWERETA